MKILFLDESGDHNLDPKKIDASYPLFVLAGCIFDEKYYQEEVIPNFNKIKEDFFGNTDIVFHTAEMIRPSKTKEKRFHKLTNQDFRIAFYTALNEFFRTTDFSLIACAIKKHAHLDAYGISALDPYLLSFDNLLSRFIPQIKATEQGTIIAEKRNSILDNQLEIAWLNAKVSGTKSIGGSEVKDKIDNLRMFPKAKNEIGLQIADLVASPIGRKILEAKQKLGQEVDFNILKDKFLDKNGIGKSNDFTIFPEEQKN